MINSLQGIDEGISRGLDRLIIDLSLNGGGHICTGRSLLNYLFPMEQNWGPTDMPVSPLSINLTDSSLQVEDVTFWTPQQWRDEDGYQFTNTSWLYPGVEKQRGHFSRNFSQLIHASSRSCPHGNGNSFPARQLNPSEILIVSHGFCGSTCALFANHLHQYENVKTLSVGGLGQQQMAYSSFPGLQVRIR